MRARSVRPGGNRVLLLRRLLKPHAGLTPVPVALVGSGTFISSRAGALGFRGVRSRRGSGGVVCWGGAEGRGGSAEARQAGRRQLEAEAGAPGDERRVEGVGSCCC